MRTLVLLAGILSLSGCSVSHYVNREVKNSSILSQHLTGISLQRVGAEKTLATYNDKQYFNPASNTKLFSFYAGVSALGDSIPGLEYLEWGELLLIRGTGDPSLLHPDLPHSHVYDFLKGRKEQIFYTSVNFENKRFGPGWAWDDYNDYYQPEVTALPLYGNVARFSGRAKQRFDVSPKHWEKFLVKDTITSGISRDEFQNIFHHSKFVLPEGLNQDLPVRMSDELLVQLLNDTLKTDIKTIQIPLNIELQKVYSIPSDSLYTLMMQVSDNMLAEQLMLVYASANGLPLNTEKAIEHAKSEYLSDLPDKPVWKDGSGLSRYNLFTPRSIVALLQKTYEKVPKERLFSILPAGGKSGTLKNSFKSEQPFIFAKTGSMSNTYNLSGYLITKKGKTIAFSFMNNNFTRPMSEIKKEVERILTGIHQRF
jgi:D-alanyl-D-alanine carboxypeptidase/D-alanyl-D-alanine-endopeptidase (penicillin-binding protein 4)